MNIVGLENDNYLSTDSIADSNGTKLLDLIHPVGSIYMSFDSTDPKDIFGGEWEQIKDRFIYAAGSKSVNTTGGEENHTLTAAEMPTHGHNLYLWNGGGTLGPAKFWDNTGVNDIAVSNGGMVITTTSYAWFNGRPNVVAGGNGDPGGRSDRVGLGRTHNNMPPYLVAYMWKRTK